MRTLLLGLLLLGACTKPNPNRCCTDAADCMAQGLPADSMCGDGLLCRGGQCIAQSCTSANDCDASAPFCIDQACTEGCTADDQCPGFGGDASRTFCVSGACEQCRVGSNADCSGATPVCDAGSCRICKAHSECASGVCAADGSCAAESDVAYVEPGASDTTDCSKATKCSLPHGVSLARRYVLLSPGTFTLSSTLTLSGTLSLIGASTTRPSITSSFLGSILQIGSGAEITLENLQVRGATGTGSGQPYGHGILCPVTPAGARHLRLISVDVLQNQYSGVDANRCTVDASHSTFANNSFNGLGIVDGGGVIEGCSASGNGNEGFTFDIGLYTIRNSFSFRNAGAGFSVDGSQGTTLESVTAVDNGVGIHCNSFTFPNNLVVRNGTNVTTCTLPSSIISDMTTGINFKSPDGMPYDYHLTSGSIAIDMATTPSTNNVDYDGDARPQGSAPDVGADEYKP